MSATPEESHAKREKERIDTMTTAEMDIKETLALVANRRGWKKFAYWALALALIASAVTFWATGKKAAAAKSGYVYRTEPARMGDLTVTVTATGQLKPTRTVEVGSQVSGIIDQVLVNYNDHVKKDQVLARIDTEKLDAQVEQDKASLASARAKVEDAKVTVTETDAEYKRMLDARERSKSQIVSQHDVDTAKAAYGRAVVAVTTADAAVTQAEANLKIDQTNVAFAVIRSPVDGIVLARNVEPGQTIAASFQVATMFEIAEDLRRMTLQVNIDEADVGQVKVGQPAYFTVDAYPGRQFPGNITSLRYNPTTNNNVVTYLAEISVNNNEMLLRPGMTATATITVLSVENALLVSNRALRFLPSDIGDDSPSGLGKMFSGPPGMSKSTKDSVTTAALNNPRVWVVRDGRPTPISVTLGATNGKFTEIEPGAVSPGTPLIFEAIKEAK